MSRASHMSRAILPLAPHVGALAPPCKLRFPRFLRAAHTLPMAHSPARRRGKTKQARFSTCRKSLLLALPNCARASEPHANGLACGDPSHPAFATAFSSLAPSPNAIPALSGCFPLRLSLFPAALFDLCIDFSARRPFCRKVDEIEKAKPQVTDLRAVWPLPLEASNLCTNPKLPQKNKILCSLKAREGIWRWLTSPRTPGSRRHSLQLSHFRAPREGECRKRAPTFFSERFSRKQTKLRGFPAIH